MTVADPTPPVVTPTLTGLLGNNGWYRGDVAVSWAAADAQSGISALSGCGQTAVTADTPGLTLTCSATSAGGTGTGTVTVKRDATPPALCAAVAPAVVLQHAGAAASATATDALSGLAGPAACGPVSTATPGARQVTCTAGDNAGNVASVAAAYTVVSVTLAVQPNAALDRNPGAVAVTGTAACSGAVAVPVSVTLTQTVWSARATRTVSGTGQGSARCMGGGAAPWTATVAGAFDRGAASAVATVVGTTPAVQSPATAVRVK